MLNPFYFIYAQVLIIGGGDGGVAREVLKHPNLEHVVLCDIDQVQVSLLFPSHSISKRTNK